MNLKSLLCLLAVCAPSIAAHARPTLAPTARHSILSGYKGQLPAVRVLPNSEIDVLFSSERKQLRWDTTLNTVTLLPTGLDIQRWSAFGNFVATREVGGGVSVIDLTTNAEHHTGGYGTPSLHDDQIAWNAGNGVGLFHAASHTPGFVSYGLGINDVRIWEDWIAFSDANSRIGAIHLPSGLTVSGRNRINSQHDLAFGRLIHGSRNALTWEHVGLPETATTVMLPSDCDESSDYRLGGSWGQLVVYVGDSCSSGEQELRLVNLDSGESYFLGLLGATSHPFDIQGNVLAFIDKNARINMMIVDESSM